jgi:hypothetical protein
MKNEWVKMLWLLLGLLSAGLGLASSAYSFRNWHWYWWLNGTCSLVAATMMLRGNVERKLLWLVLSVLVAAGLFLLNVVITFFTGFAGCARV